MTATACKNNYIIYLAKKKLNFGERFDELVFCLFYIAVHRVASFFVLPLFLKGKTVHILSKDRFTFKLYKIKVNLKHLSKERNWPLRRDLFEYY